MRLGSRLARSDWANAWPIWSEVKTAVGGFFISAANACAPSARVLNYANVTVALGLIGGPACSSPVVDVVGEAFFVR